MNVMQLPIYTQLLSITEIQKYVPISLPATKPYLLANLQRGLRKLEQENSSLVSTGKQGWFWIKTNIYCSNVYPGPVLQQLKGEKGK